MVVYLFVADIVALHAAVMHAMGDVPAPLRDEAGLESAVLRPTMAAHYEGADVVRQAAILAVAISQAQAFLDGNKRTSYIACDVFLRQNGLRFAGKPIEMARHLIDVSEQREAREAAIDRFEAWLRGAINAY